MRKLGPSLFVVFSVFTTLAGSRALSAEPALTHQETVVVTATRVPEDPIEVPASIQVVTGDELERGRISTLGEALALVMGVSIAPGGEGGPASSVPEMMGLREFDAFLLVVDDVPWGGAFNPDLATLDLTNVERIEVLRGAAPVMYGATSFVGVIHVIHRAPGASPAEGRVSGGSHGSWGLSGSSDLPGSDAWRQSISAGYDSIGFRDDRTNFDRGHLLYRGAKTSGTHHFRLDFDATLLDQDPNSPHPLDPATLTLTPLIPLDANHNPADSRQDEDRYHLVLGYNRAAWGGEWSTLLAYTDVSRNNTKGFLRAAFDVPPGLSNADGFRQTIDETDVYFDTHLAKKVSDRISLVFGVDELYGKGKMHSHNFEYHANLDGSNPPDSQTITIDENPQLEDKRSFAGIYGQVTWNATQRLRFDLGLRCNFTHEEREGQVEDGLGGVIKSSDTRSDTRGGGAVGASFRVFQHDADSLWIFGDYRNTYKPAAIDFGPEAEGNILEPEDADAFELGVKGANMGGRLTWEVSGFTMDFSNVVVATQVNGSPALENVGAETLDGAEAEVAWHMRPDLHLLASYAYHDAKFGDYLADVGGTLQQLDGNRIQMSPNDLASAGIIYRPPKGLNANAVVNYVGDRFLDKANTALAESYTTWSAGVGYRFGHAELRVDGVNLNDARDPVSQSELGEGQYYLLPSRSVMGTFVWRSR